MPGLSHFAVLLLLAPLLAGCISEAPPAQTPAQEVETEADPVQVRLRWTPAEPEAGEPVFFDLDAEGPDPVTDASWDFGDGTSERGLQPVHTYREAGTYSLQVVVETRSGARAEIGTEIHISGAAPGPTTEPAATQPPLAPPVLHWNLTVNHLEASFEWDRKATAVRWEFGDGATGNTTTASHDYLATGLYELTLTVWEGERSAEATGEVEVTEVPFVPHVVVGIPDSGFNVYHEVYRRPDLTDHPCTYIQDYPCDIPALNLTLDARDWQAAFAADKAKWEAIRPGDRYWIPGTNIIGAVCDQPYEGSNAASTNPLGGIDHCILDDTSMHGTGTSSSVLSENPDALLIVVEGNSGGDAYLTDGYYPVDVVSYSWGAAVPLVGFGPLLPGYAPLYVAASGNEGAFPVALDGTKAHTSIITVGAADAGSRSEPGYSGWKTMDFVSEYCRPTAQTESIHEMRDQYCGTSFSAPTFAGALSKVILELRERSGYTGSIVDGMVDPILGVTKTQVREALNHTATYTPEDAFDDGGDLVPLVAPWYQWGWGYIARNEVPGVIACLLEDDCPERPAETVAYMETVWELRRIQSGEALGL